MTRLSAEQVEQLRHILARMQHGAGVPRFVRKAAAAFQQAAFGPRPPPALPQGVQLALELEGVAWVPRPERAAGQGAP